MTDSLRSPTTPENNGDIENRLGQRKRRLTSPEPMALGHFAAHTLIVPQAAQEADLGGEDAVVGDLEQQLLTWDQHRRSGGVSGPAAGRQSVIEHCADLL